MTMENRAVDRATILFIWGLGPMLSLWNFAFDVAAALLRTCRLLHHKKVKEMGPSPLLLARRWFCELWCGIRVLIYKFKVKCSDLTRDGGMQIWLNEMNAITLLYHFEGIAHILFLNRLFNIGKGLRPLVCTHTPNIWSATVLWRQKPRDRRDAIEMTSSDALLVEDFCFLSIYLPFNICLVLAVVNVILRTHITGLDHLMVFELVRIKIVGDFEKVRAETWGWQLYFFISSGHQGKTSSIWFLKP